MFAPVTCEQVVIKQIDKHAAHAPPQRADARAAGDEGRMTVGEAVDRAMQRDTCRQVGRQAGGQRSLDEVAEQAADAVGRSRPAASNLLRLLQLSAPVQELLMTGKLDMGHARALLPLNGAQQVAVAQRVVQHGLSVREAERLVQQIIQPPKPAAEQPVDRDLLRLQEEISDRLGAAVAIRSSKKGSGKITIEFGDLDQLEGILGRLR